MNLNEEDILAAIFMAGIVKPQEQGHPFWRRSAVIMAYEQAKFFLEIKKEKGEAEEKEEAWPPKEVRAPEPVAAPAPKRETVPRTPKPRQQLKAQTFDLTPPEAMEGDDEEGEEDDGDSLNQMGPEHNS